MLTQFRTLYPQGSLISDLVTIDRGQYIVKVTLQVEGVILSTGLAAADKIETAEDNARERALFALSLDIHPQRNFADSSLPNSTVTVANQTDTVTKSSSDLIANHKSQRAKNSNLVNLSFKQDSTPARQSSLTEKETNKIESIRVNTSKSTEPTNLETTHNLSESSTTPQSTADSSTRKSDQINKELPTQEASDFDASPSDFPAEAKEEKPDNLQPEITTATQTIETVEFDFNEIKNRTDVEIKRLGWTKEQGRDFLLQNYGKRSRLHLTDEELMDFLHYLESQPNPI